MRGSSKETWVFGEAGRKQIRKNLITLLWNLDLILTTLRNYWRILKAKKRKLNEQYESLSHYYGFVLPLERAHEVLGTTFKVEFFSPSVLNLFLSPFHLCRHNLIAVFLISPVWIVITSFKVAALSLCPSLPIGYAVKMTSAIDFIMLLSSIRIFLFFYQ